jgi:hypothetical protein
LQWLAVVAGALPVPSLRLWAQTASFPGKHYRTLRDLAAIVLPASLGPDGLERVVQRFERWARDYRAGAELDHGYGLTRVRYKSASPAPLYLAQLEKLCESLLGADREARRTAVETALGQAKITELPRMPDGKHVISDLMSFYFSSSEANDLCYRAAIERYRCRGLEGSHNPPPPIKGLA